MAEIDKLPADRRRQNVWIDEWVSVKSGRELNRVESENYTIDWLTKKTKKEGMKEEAKRRRSNERELWKTSEERSWLESSGREGEDVSERRGREGRAGREKGSWNGGLNINTYHEK